MSTIFRVVDTEVNRLSRRTPTHRRRADRMAARICAKRLGVVMAALRYLSTRSLLRTQYPYLDYLIKYYEVMSRDIRRADQS